MTPFYRMVGICCTQFFSKMARFICYLSLGIYKLEIIRVFSIISYFLKLILKLGFLCENMACKDLQILHKSVCKELPKTLLPLRTYTGTL